MVIRASGCFLRPGGPCPLRRAGLDAIPRLLVPSSTRGGLERHPLRSERAFRAGWPAGNFVVGARGPCLLLWQQRSRARLLLVVISDSVTY